MVQPSITLLALVVGTGIVTGWLFVRVRNGSVWHRTPLEWVLPLWGAALVSSTVVNWPTFDNSVVGLWFTGLYILCWYVACDVLNNHLLSAVQMINGLLLGSIPVLISALQQYARRPVRIFGFMENPNILGALLILVIPLALDRYLPGGRWRRILLALYLAVAVLVLLLTRSRGAIFGLSCAFGFMLMGRVKRRDVRLIILGLGLLIALLLLFNRDDSARLHIYENALSSFASHLLVGQGLFTYRNMLPDVMSLPPNGQNLHAYNLWLQIGVELGLLGITALSVTIVQFARAAQQARQHPWIVAALFGIFAAQLADFTLMTPSIAICAILLLAIVASESAPSPTSTRWPVWLLCFLAILLALSGSIAQHIPRFML